MKKAFAQPVTAQEWGNMTVAAANDAKVLAWRSITVSSKHWNWNGRNADGRKNIMAINSRSKGAAGEREFAGLIHDQLGIRLVRNLEQVRNGGHDLSIHPDECGPVVDSLNRFAIEVKRYAQTTPALIKGWWNQAIEQAKTINKYPALAYRANQRDWVILVPMHTINPVLPVSDELEYTAAFSVSGFCSIVREVI